MMKWNLLDLLFSHPEYTGPAAALEFEGRIEEEKLQEAIAAWIKGNPELPQLVPTLEIRKTEEDLNHDDPASLMPHAVMVISGDGVPWAFRLVRGLKKDVLFVSISHQLGDGVSFVTMILSIASICSGKSPLPLNLDRTLIEKVVSQVKLEDDQVKLSDMGVTGQRAYEKTTEEKMVRYRRKFVSDEEVKSLMGESRITAVEIISAMILKEKNQDTVLLLPFNLRKIKFGIPMNYFGNAVKAESEFFAREEIATKSVPELALKIKAMKEKSTLESLAKSYRFLEKIYAMKGIEGIQQLRITDSRSILITDLSKLPTKIPFGSALMQSMTMLSPYPQAAPIMRAEGGYFYQLGSRA